MSIEDQANGAACPDRCADVACDPQPEPCLNARYAAPVTGNCCGTWECAEAEVWRVLCAEVECDPQPECSNARYVVGLTDLGLGFPQTRNEKFSPHWFCSSQKWFWNFPEMVLLFTKSRLVFFVSQTFLVW